MLVLPSRNIGPGWAAIFGVAIATGLSALSFGHPVYVNHVEHHVHLSVGPTNIDVTIELRFNELRSLTERRRMDTDRDGLITAAERARYLRRIRRELDDAFRLSSRGQELNLIELYEPKLDLLGDDGVSPAHHSLRLYYFARTPAGLVGPAGLKFEDRAWTSGPSLFFLRSAGSQGVNVRVAPAPTSQPAGDRDSSLRGYLIADFSAPATRPAESSGTD